MSQNDKQNVGRDQGLYITRGLDDFDPEADRLSGSEGEEDVQNQDRHANNKEITSLLHKWTRGDVLRTAAPVLETVSRKNRQQNAVAVTRAALPKSANDKINDASLQFVQGAGVVNNFKIMQNISTRTIKYTDHDQEENQDPDTAAAGAATAAGGRRHGGTVSAVISQVKGLLAGIFMHPWQRLLLLFLGVLALALTLMLITFCSMSAWRLTLEAASSSPPKSPNVAQAGQGQAAASNTAQVPLEHVKVWGSGDKEHLQTSQYNPHPQHTSAVGHLDQSRAEMALSSITTELLKYTDQLARNVEDLKRLRVEWDLLTHSQETPLSGFCSSAENGGIQGEDSTLPIQQDLDMAVTEMQRAIIDQVWPVARDIGPLEAHRQNILKEITGLQAKWKRFNRTSSLDHGGQPLGAYEKVNPDQAPHEARRWQANEHRDNYHEDGESIVAQLLVAMTTLASDAHSIAQRYHTVNGTLADGVKQVSNRLKSITKQCEKVLRYDWAAHFDSGDCPSSPTSVHFLEGKCASSTTKRKGTGAGMDRTRIDIRRGVIEAAWWVCSGAAQAATASTAEQVDGTTGRGNVKADFDNRDYPANSPFAFDDEVSLAGSKALNQLAKVQKHTAKGAVMAQRIADKAEALRAGLERQLSEMVKARLENQRQRQWQWHWQWLWKWQWQCVRRLIRFVKIVASWCWRGVGWAWRNL